MRSLIKIISLLLVASCSAADLGDQAAPAISVDTTNPTWDNGIHALITAKCANCHTAARSKFVPSNVPATVNDMTSESFFDGSTVQKQGWGYTIALKVFHDKHYPMPTHFATPLNSDENTALKLYLKNKGFDVDTACPTTESTLTWTDVESTIKDKCATSACHASTNKAIHPLETLEQVKLYRSKSIAYIVAGFMPQGAVIGFLSSSSGSRLREWLCAGTEFH